MEIKKRDAILIVDDMVSSRIYLRNIFKSDYEILEAGNGEIALRQLRDHRSRVAAVLLDVVMPGKDGYRTLVDMKKEGFLQEIPVLIVTAHATSGSEANALELGACDMIRKPFDPYAIKRRVAIMVELFQSRRKLESKVEDLSKVVNAANTSIINTLASATEFRSLESGQHIIRIQEFTRIILESVAQTFPQYELNDRVIELISSAAALHDIGKIAIPDAILNKPGKLTEEEFEIMKTHATSGCQLLRNMNDALDEEYMQYAYNICRYHHERWDGGGYPDGLKRDNIPLCAQVVALADVYDALTTRRVYKEAYSHEESMRMIFSGECGDFNPEMLICFKQAQNRLEDCARAYADEDLSLEQQSIRLPAPVPVAEGVALDTEHLTMAKYHTMLQVIDGAVIEVDMDAGTFRLIYDTSDAFGALREGNDIRKALQNLLQVVHPEDKPAASAHMISLQKEFFDDGLRRQSQHYRVRSSPTSGYFWVEAISLRVDTRNPNERKAICVWKQLTQEEPAGVSTPAPGVPSKWGHQFEGKFWDKFPWMLLRSRMDRGMTIERGGERLVGLLGYTMDELEKQFRNHLQELIMPEDQQIVQSHLRGSRAHGDSAAVEYRLRCKDGSHIWVQDYSRVIMGDDGVEHVYRILQDITKSKEERERLYLSLEGYQLLMSQSDEIYFEWNTEKNEIFFTENFGRTFGAAANGDPIRRQEDILDIIHPDDIPIFREMMEESREGKRVSTKEFRIRKADESYLWCRVRVACRWQAEGGKANMVGTITNIHEEKLAVQRQIEYDALTKVFNRAAGTTQIERYLDNRMEGDRAALLVLDIDNFKTVNDKYGHMTGDMVLLTCAEVLRSLFRSSDIIARLGGDEFMIFLKGVPDREVAERCCQSILNQFNKTVERLVPGGIVSCSIGVAMVPEGGVFFPALFQHADQALLYAKEKGKNRFAFYSDLGGQRVSYTSARTQIESDERPSVASTEFMEYALRHLYQTGDVEETLREMIAMVGRQMNVSRVYIFENSRDNRYCNNTFEWCNEGIVPEIDNLQKLSYADDIPGWMDNYNREGVFYCPDISKLPKKHRVVLEPQGIKSMLQCAIWEGGAFRGFVGFDECVVDRLWTQEQIDALRTLSELISLFLLKKRNQDDMVRWTESLLHILNGSNNWMYVVDPETLKILFLNDKIMSLKKIRLGDQCHEVIMGRKEQCKNCPIKQLDTAEIGRMEATVTRLGPCIKAEAHSLDWEGQEAVLVICEEVSQ